MEKPTKETIQKWKEVYEEHKNLLSPNLKSVAQVMEYLKEKYPLRENTSEKFRDIVIKMVMNQPLSSKVPVGNELKPMVFIVSNEGNAKVLYESQEEVYKGGQIIVGMESETNLVYVEGSGELADEITAFQGLDKGDIGNFYLVANYIRCLKKYNLLEEVLKPYNS